ncbi:acyl-CoA thioesterase [Myroides sp. LJL116]
MSRVKLTMPKNYIFSTQIPVRITDLNYGNHLGNDKLVSLIHQARVLFLDSFKYTELDCEKVGLIMADLAIEYKNQAFFNDILTFEIAADNFTKVSFDLFYLVSCKDKTIAKVKTGMVTFDYTTNKVTPVPTLLSTKFQAE